MHLSQSSQLWWAWPITALILLLSPLFLYWAKSGRRKAIVRLSNLRRPPKPLSKAEVETKQDNVVVTALYVHPIKSCRGTSIKEARWTPTGFQFDRSWCIVNEEDHHVLTLRAVGEMVRILPRIEVDPASPYGGLLVVDVPRGDGYETFSLPLVPTQDILDRWEYIQGVTMFNIFTMDGHVCQSVNPSDRSPADILSDFLGQRVLLMMKGSEDRMSPPTNAFPDLKATVAYPDAYPIHLSTKESLDSLSSTVNDVAQLGKDTPKDIRGITNEWASRKLEMERFRPNIVLEGTGAPYVENLWREIDIVSKMKPDGKGDGYSQRMDVVRTCARCLLPNVHPESGERDPAVPHKVIVKYGDADEDKKPVFGIYAVPKGEGVIRVGDKLAVNKWIEEDDDD